MAPMQAVSLFFHTLSPRADDDNEFNATPAEAVVVPVAIFILILVSAAIISVYRHWRRRNYNNQSLKAYSSPRKLVPSWLSTWIDPLKTKPIGADSQTRGFDHGDTVKQSRLVHENHPSPSSNSDLDSDTIALRPISLSLPAYPLTMHDPYDRYPPVTNYNNNNIHNVRPKVMGVPLR